MPPSLVSPEPGGKKGTLALPVHSGIDLLPRDIASRPAALVTATLLFMGDGSNVFGGVQPNMWGRGLRAYDKRAGEVPWETEPPARATGAPMTYVHDVRQYIVVPISRAR